MAFPFLFTFFNLILDAPRTFFIFRVVLSDFGFKVSRNGQYRVCKKDPPPCPPKFDMGNKNAKFDADLDFVKKVAKNTCENVINEIMTEKWSY